MSARRLRILLLAAIVAIAAGCAMNEASAPLEKSLAGDATRGDATRNALGLSLANLDKNDRTRFEQGDSFFTQNWVTAPSSTVSRDGLGPVFNAQACASCHALDGRGAPPADEADATTRGLLLRLSIPGETRDGAPMPEPNYGDQLQDRAVTGVPAEGRMSIGWDDVAGTYGDGTPFELRAPRIAIEDLTHGPLHPDTMISARLAPQVAGGGLLEAIPERDIIGRADEDDEDGDGISGRPNYVHSTSSNGEELGRFGWKANAATLADQTAGAFAGDIGITSPLHPMLNCSASQMLCIDAPSGGEPEVDEARFGAVVFYVQSIALPEMRNTGDDEVKDGARQFQSMGCASCHTPKMKTGEAEYPALSNQTIYPFTDLLLHDMGEGLADDRPDFEASGREWRTPPLWGLGVVDDVNGHRFLLHDGRARSFSEAILWHGGEGEASREKFRNASRGQREALLAYLEAL